MPVWRNGDGNTQVHMGPPPARTQVGPSQPLPPPSSLANYIRAAEESDGRPMRDEFQSLLNEILGPEGWGADDTATNHKLVTVVTGAGLSSLLTEEPSTSSNQLQAQATSSLHFIKLVIENYPQILFCPPPAECSPSEQQFLFLWLLARLVPLLGHPKAQPIVEEISEIIEAIFTTASKLPQGWVHLKTMAQYLRNCSKCIVHYLRTIQAIKDTVCGKFLLELPGPDFTIDDCSLGGLPPPDPSSVCFRLSTPQHAASMLARIFTTLHQLIARSDKSWAVGDTLAHTIWAQQDVALLWEALPMWYSVPQLQEMHNSMQLSILQAVDKALEKLMVVPSYYAQCSEVCFLTTGFLVGTLKCPEKQTQKFERTLASIISQLLNLSDALPTTTQHLKDSFLPTITDVMLHNNSWSLRSPEMRLAIIATVGYLGEREDDIQKAQELLQADTGGTLVAQDEKLKMKLMRLMPGNQSQQLDSASSSKHLRLDTLRNQNQIAEALIRNINVLLGNGDSGDLTGLSSVAGNAWNELERDKRVDLMKDWGLLSCALAGDLTDIRTIVTGSPICECSYCDAETPGVSERRWADGRNSELFETFEMLLKLDSFQESPEVRTWAMDSLRRMLNHTQELVYLDVTQMTLGKWCLQSLKSSQRVLRIAAGRTVSSFLTLHDEGVLEKNRHVILTHLDTMTTEEESIFQESCVLTYGQLGRVSMGLVLHLALIRLVNYLGHRDAFIAAVAFTELQSTATAHDLTPRKLLSPFWQSIGVAVVSKLISKPHVVALLSELLLMSVSQFVHLTQEYTLPWLILQRKVDIVQKIAQFVRGDGDVRLLCHDNITAILSCLLVQESEDPAAATMSLLAAVSSDFKKFTLESLVWPEAIQIASQILRSIQEEDEAQRALIHKGLRLVAECWLRKIEPPRGKHKKDKIKHFVENNVLGICTWFSDVLKDTKGKTPLLEKLRCLRGIAEMARVAQGAVSPGLPQIITCLQDALEHDELRTTSFSAWCTVVQNLPEEDLIAWLGPTFAVVLQLWNEKFDNKARDRAQELVIYLFNTHFKLLIKPESMVPSLESIPLFSKFNAKLEPYRAGMELRERFRHLIRRCHHENVAVLERGLLELKDLIKESQDFLYTSAMSEQPDPIISKLLRCLLDVVATFKDPAQPAKRRVEQLCATCLGLIGAVDPNRIDAPRASEDMMVLDNFDRAEECTSFVMFFLEHRLVKAFKSATDTKKQTFLAYAIQELLRYCDFAPGIIDGSRSDGRAGKQKNWEGFSQQAQITLRPFLQSKYILSSDVPRTKASYPIFSPSKSHRDWLQSFILDLLSKPSGVNAKTIFSICSRIIRGQDRSILTFLLPFVALHVIISGTSEDRENIKLEFLAILGHEGDTSDPLAAKTIRSCSETVFLVVDHLTKYIRDKRRELRFHRSQQARAHNRHPKPDDVEADIPGIEQVEALLTAIPPDLMGLRSLECNSYARALLYWEQHIRQVREKCTKKVGGLYEKLQDIYTNIDEPDGIEGISSKLHVLNVGQQIMEHRKAGRWAAAQTWYEMVLREDPTNIESQMNLITCLKESGQHSILLDKIDGMIGASVESHTKLLPFAVESSWADSRWDLLDKYLGLSNARTESAHEIHLGRILLALHRNDGTFAKEIAHARECVIGEMTPSFTGTVRQCHDSMVRLHALSEMDVIVHQPRETEADCGSLAQLLDRRLGLMGTYNQDKQHVLALRRAVFNLSGNTLGLKGNLASAWLSSSRLARKSKQTRQSFDAVLHAFRLSPPHATIEHAKLLWHEGQHRKATQNIESAIHDKLLDVSQSVFLSDADMTAVSAISGRAIPQSNMPAKAYLLYARWLDDAGQMHTKQLNDRYQDACNTNLRWEQGHYYLGRFYSKLYDTERLLPPSKQSEEFLKGDICKLVIFSYLRALAFGTKYIFKTLPRILTLWLDMGDTVKNGSDDLTGLSQEFVKHMLKDRPKFLKSIHVQISKYTTRLPTWMFLTAFPQIMSRITHKHEEVNAHLQNIIVRVTADYPQQALWHVMSSCKSTDKDRSTRGLRVIQQIKKDNGSGDIRLLIQQAVKLSEQLLNLCNHDISGKHVSFSLRRDASFNHTVAPCPLVIPLQSALTVVLPSPPNAVKNHKPFTVTHPTIEAFHDEGDIMNSLQKPRKIKIRGSDGHNYTFLCKPRDDLRKDARLMEFNNMINRFLKKDLEASRRTLNIRTYHVTPLNEECGLIEWVNNCRPLRDIIIKNYRLKGIPSNYNEWKALLDIACTDPKKIDAFSVDLLKRTPAVFHEWFLETFSEPAAWFDARLRYARTAAVMSIVGHVLGLGDRHGENILFDETNGQTLHVDFNCLFDKGLTFEKPEKVPFRLTHNMVDAMGVTGYEGVFRKACEVTMRVLRTNEETLMTVLETFIHDPAVDMVKRKRSNNKVPDTPKAVLESIRGKLRGLIDGEQLSLSVEGHVDMLIQKATSPANLCAMYIGWCPMF